MKLIFKNFEPSDFLSQKVEDRIWTVLRKHQPDKPVDLVVTLEMENSPFKKGPDVYTTTVKVSGTGVIDCLLKKSAINAVASIAAASESLQVVLSKKKRLAQRSQSRLD